MHILIKEINWSPILEETDYTKVKLTGKVKNKKWLIRLYFINVYGTEVSMSWWVPSNQLKRCI